MISAADFPRSCRGEQKGPRSTLAATNRVEAGFRAVTSWWSLLLSILLSTLLGVQHGQAAGNSLTLAWDATPGDTVGYKVYCGGASRNYTNVLNSAGTTSVVTGLMPGATYYFAVTTCTSSGLESAYSAEAAYTVPAISQNRAPTLDSIAAVAVLESAGAQTVALSGISSGASTEIQTLTILATSEDPNLIPNPTVSYHSPETAGTLSFIPVPGRFGTTKLNVLVDDGGSVSNTTLRSFTVTVLPVNDPPTLDALSDIALQENTPALSVALTGISSGATNEADTLAVTAVSSNPDVVPNPVVTYSTANPSGSLTLLPAHNASGTAVITVNVNDGQPTNNFVSRSFTVTVLPVNQPPTLDAIADLNLPVNAGKQTVQLSGITSGASNEYQTLVVTAASANTTLVPAPVVTYTSPGTAGTLTFTPATNGTGSALITVRVNDSAPSNNVTAKTFTVNVGQGAGQTTFTNVLAAPDVACRVVVPAPNRDRLTYGFAAAPPAGAKLNANTGLFSWKPTRAQALTTNLINIQVTDNDVSARSTNLTFLVTVLDYVEVSLGGTALLAGQGGSLPLTVSSSSGITNLSFSFSWNSNKFSSPSLSGLAPGLSSSLVSQGTSWLLTLKTGSGLQGSNAVATLNFQTASNQPSAFLEIGITNLTAARPDGKAYVNVLSHPGQVAVINKNPLLRGQAGSGASRTLMVFGNTGATYEIQSCTNLLGQLKWQPLLSFTQTNLVQSVDAGPAPAPVFYRLLQK